MTITWIEFAFALMLILRCDTPPPVRAAAQGFLDAWYAGQDCAGAYDTLQDALVSWLVWGWMQGDAA